jgi:hypothetical protein
MPVLKDVEFGYGAITHCAEIPATPTTTERDGNVTIHNEGSPGVPGHFRYSAMLSADFEEEGVKFHNIFHWETLIVGKPGGTPYAELDADAARHIAPMLRDVAASIEAQVAEYDAKREAKKEGS